MYFLKLFSKHQERVMYCNTVIELCSPTHLDIAVIGDKGCGKSRFISQFCEIALRLQNPEH